MRRFIRGNCFQAEFLEPLEMTQYRLAKNLSVPARRINEIVHGIRAISADTERDRLGSRLAREVGVFAKAS